MIAYIEPCYVDIHMLFAIAFSFDMIQNPFYNIFSINKTDCLDGYDDKCGKTFVF